MGQYSVLEEKIKKIEKLKFLCNVERVILTINDAPHVGTKPHCRSGIRLILSDQNWVGYRQKSNQSTVLQESKYFRFIGKPTIDANFFHLGYKYLCNGRKRTLEQVCSHQLPVEQILGASALSFEEVILTSKKSPILEWERTAH